MAACDIYLWYISMAAGSTRQVVVGGSRRKLDFNYLIGDTDVFFKLFKAEP